MLFFIEFSPNANALVFKYGMLAELELGLHMVQEEAAMKATFINKHAQKCQRSAHMLVFLACISGSRSPQKELVFSNVRVSFPGIILHFYVWDMCGDSCPRNPKKKMWNSQKPRVFCELHLKVWPHPSALCAPTPHPPPPASFCSQCVTGTQRAERASHSGLVLAHSCSLDSINLQKPQVTEEPETFLKSEQEEEEQKRTTDMSGFPQKTGRNEEFMMNPETQCRNMGNDWKVTKLALKLFSDFVISANLHWCFVIFLI